MVTLMICPCEDSEVCPREKKRIKRQGTRESARIQQHGKQVDANCALENTKIARKERGTHRHKQQLIRSLSIRPRDAQLSTLRGCIEVVGEWSCG